MKIRGQQINLRGLSPAQARKVHGVEHAATAFPMQAAELADPLVDQARWRIQDQVLGLSPTWKVTQGQGVTVAVIDTGVDFSHRELQHAQWTNPDEIPANGVDDDQNGYIDDVHGVSIIGGSSEGDVAGHGTHVAGIIAAAHNNEGIAGVAPRARIMSVRVLDQDGLGDTEGVADGIRYAIGQGARILNLSLNGRGSSAGLESAIEEAEQAGAVVVAAAGNESLNLEQTAAYPASFANPNIISVASSGDQGAVSSFSNWGPVSVDLAAYGENIVSTERNGAFAVRSGTSMATPQVSALIALMATSLPGHAPTQWRQALLQTTVTQPGLQGRVATGGIPNVQNAINWLASQPIIRDVDPVPVVSTPKFSSVKITRSKNLRAWKVRIRWKLVPRKNGVRVLISGPRKVKKTVKRSSRLTISSLPPGRYTLRLEARTNDGKVAAAKKTRFNLARIRIG